jgi:hypothetical protein
MHSRCQQKYNPDFLADSVELQIGLSADFGIFLCRKPAFSMDLSLEEAGKTSNSLFF